MASRFSTQMKRAAARLSVRQFGESVIYYPRSGGSREIDARIERGTPEVIAETGDITTQAVIVTVENDKVRGITSDEIDTGGDELSLSLRIGLSAQRRSIVRLITNNGPFVRFLVQ